MAKNKFTDEKTLKLQFCCMKRINLGGPKIYVPVKKLENEENFLTISDGFSLLILDTLIR